MTTFQQEMKQVKLPAPRFLLIAAIVLIVIVLVPLVVIEKARWDAKKYFSPEKRFKLIDVEFGGKELVILKLAPEPDAAETVTNTIYWSLRQWDVTLIISFPDAFGGLSALDKPIDLGDIIEDAEDSGPQDLPRFILSGPEVEPERVQDVP